jgi:hypothetical protein
MQATSQLSVRYIAPGDVSSTLAMSAVVDYVGSAAGFIDVPEAAVDGTSYAVPFGSVAAPKLIALKNDTLLAVEISINASEDVFTLGAGDMLVLGGPAAVGVTSVSVILTATQTADGKVSYIVLGDSETP